MTIGEKAEVHIVAAIKYQLKRIVRLSMATQTQRLRHQYSIFDAHYATIIRNARPGASAGQSEEQNECAYHELRLLNVLN